MILYSYLARQILGVCVVAQLKQLQGAERSGAEQVIALLVLVPY